MITGINELRTLTKHISCKCKCKFDRRKCNSDQRWNNDKCGCVCKRRHVCKKRNKSYKTTKKKKLFQQILIKNDRF